MDEPMYGEAASTPKADEFVPVTIQVHVAELASFYAAVAAWAGEGDGGRGRTRVA